MDTIKQEAAIEAVLFSLGNAVDLEKLADILEEDVDATYEALQHLKEKYSDENRGIELIELEGRFQLCSKKGFYEYIKKATNKVVKYELTDVLLETLSIVAYKQPVTKVHVEQIRGVKSDHAINRLVDYGLVEEKGRLEAPGRPILFGTTEVFLRRFGLSSMEELPELDPDEISEIKTEVEEELKMSFENEGE